MTFALPQVLLLAIPLGLLVWRMGQVHGPATWVRTALLLTLVLALSQPAWVIRSAGSDVVVVVDRSRSMPDQSSAAAAELITLVEAQRKNGDRVGVIGFGREARIERALSADAHFGGFEANIDPEASSLAAGLERAFDLIPPERVGRVLVVSDGRVTGLDARAAARRLSARGIDVDSRWLGRDDAAIDAAITRVEGPASVHSKEPFLLSATVRSNAATTGTFSLVKNGEVISRATRAILQGNSVVTFPELADQPGLMAYEVRVSVDGDAVTENDAGRLVMRVEAAPRVLLLTDKPAGTLATTLRASKLELEVRAPGPLGMASLENVGSVVLEDVEAGRLTEPGLTVLAQFVTEAGGGLVMTGGRHSFGEGGYRKSVIEDVLPVSLELREEQRKASLALSIIMDCSCSMGAATSDGRTKMELAAEGVVGALQLLNERDEASVHMVDTSDHELFGLSPAGAGLPLGKVKRGFSGGGGIYVGVGLLAAKKEILKSAKATRHVLLFSDAADSEEPGDSRRIVGDLMSQGVTVSVIGMGSPSDPDAQLLKDIASWGHGRMYFAEDAMSLPRIFSQETIAVARASFVDTQTAFSVSADWSLLGRVPSQPPTSVNGYNLTFRKNASSIGMVTVDDNAAPLLAFWPQEAGRVAALMVEIDGEATGAFRSWAASRALVEQVVRWSMPAQTDAASFDAVVRSSLQGNDLHVTLDVARESLTLVGSPRLVLLPGDARVKPIELPLRWEDEDRLGAHVALEGSGTWYPVVKLANRVYRAAPATLSWAPEFEPGSAKEGRETLAAVTKAGNGVERLSMTGLFRDAMKSEGAVPLTVPLVVLSVVLLLAEVCTRRFWTGLAPAKAEAIAAVAAPPHAAQSKVANDELTDAMTEARRRAKGRLNKD